MAEKPDIQKIKDSFIDKLELQYSTTLEDASHEQIYQALSATIVETLKRKRRKFINKAHSNGKKKIYYLSMEFLMGRSLKTSLYNLEIINEVRDMLKESDVDIEDIFNCEPDAGLGNGGLGRLAACYMDAMAS